VETETIDVINPPLRLLAAFARRFPDREPSIVLQAPGRDLWTAAVVLGTRQYRIEALDLRARAVFSRQSAKRRETTLRRPLPRWSRYAAGVMLALDNMIDVPGIVALICGDEAPGPRWDYSVGILFAALWHEIAGETARERDLIALVDRVQRDYVGWE
jgi:hypothetical protein